MWYVICTTESQDINVMFVTLLMLIFLFSCYFLYFFVLPACSIPLTYQANQAASKMCALCTPHGCPAVRPSLSVQLTVLVRTTGRPDGQTTSRRTVFYWAWWCARPKGYNPCRAVVWALCWTGTIAGNTGLPRFAAWWPGPPACLLAWHTLGKTECTGQ